MTVKCQHRAGTENGPETARVPGPPVYQSAVTVMALARSFHQAPEKSA